MKTKYVCPSLISPHANFHNDWKMETLTLLEKKLQVGGGKEKEPKLIMIYNY